MNRDDRRRWTRDELPPDERCAVGPAGRHRWFDVADDASKPPRHLRAELVSEICSHCGTERTRRVDDEVVASATPAPPPPPPVRGPFRVEHIVAAANAALAQVASPRRHTPGDVVEVARRVGHAVDGSEVLMSGQEYQDLHKLLTEGPEATG